MKKNLSIFLFIFSSALALQNATANTAQSPNLPLDHCYHWLRASAGYLKVKYDHAAKNSGELTFFTTPQTSNGAIAGAGLYCAKSPSGSYTYGDRLIKISFVRDVVINNASTRRNTCGVDGRSAGDDNECQNKKWDVQLYNTSSAWYVIQNPAAIAKWTAVSNDLIQDLEADRTYSGAEYSNHVAATIERIKQDSTYGNAQNAYIINANARMTLAALLKKNPSSINSIPTMSVLGDLSSAEARKELGPETLKWVQNIIARRFLTDPSMQYKEIRDLLKADSDLRKIFADEGRKLLGELAKEKISSVNLLALVGVMNLDANSKVVFTPGFFDLLLKDSAAMASFDLGADPLQSSIEEQFNRSLQARLDSRSPMIPQLLRHLDLAQQLKMSANSIDPLKQQLTDAIKQAGITDHGLKVKSSLYPILGTLQDSIGLCTSYITSLKLFNEDIFLKLGDTELNLGDITTNQDPKAFCEARTDYFKGLVRSLSTGKKISFVIGTIQNEPFVFQVTYLDDLVPQIQQFMNDKKIQLVDRISFNMNSNPTKYLVNRSTAWTSANQIVNSMSAYLSQHGLRTEKQTQLQQSLERDGQAKALMIEGRINSQSFTMAANDNVEAVQLCANYAAAYDMSAVESIQLSVNKSEAVSLTNDKSYWQGPKEVCGVLQQLVMKATKK